MNEDAWSRWLLRGARTWADLSDAMGETGVEAIDRDHRRMGEYLLEINGLAEEAAEKGLGISVIARQESLLRDFLAFTEGHFEREELLIAEWGLPGLEAQREQHERILRSLRSAIEDFAAGKLTVTKTLKVSMLEWVVGHVNEGDRSTFATEHWRGKFASAASWEDLSALVMRTGVGEIDEQHRATTIKILELAAALRDGLPASERARGLLAELASLARSHFEYEEEFLLRHRLGSKEEREAARASFLGPLSSYAELLAGAGGVPAGELKAVLLEKWLGHVNELDRRDFSARGWMPAALGRASAWRDLAGFVRKSGVDAIDADHRELLERCLRLGRVLDRRGLRGGSVEDFVAAFDSVLAFAASHFEREEGLERRLGGAESLEARRSERESLAAELGDMRGDIAEGRLPPSASVKLRLMERLIEHANRGGEGGLR